MKPALTFTIEGPPVPLKRHRSTKTGKIYNPQTNLKLRQALELRTQHRLKPLMDGPLLINVQFFMKIPSYKLKSIPENSLHHIKPDIDNLLKWLMDIAKNVLYHDDSQICCIQAEKRYASHPHTEFTLIEVD